MPTRKKVLYYGLMVFLTLLVLEGMARIAYLAAYGDWYGGGRADSPLAADAPTSPELFEPWLIRHPFYGLTHQDPSHPLNAMPPQQRQEEMVVIGLLGGSVAEGLEPYLQEELERYFTANNLSRQPVLLGLTIGGAKQPQQTTIIAYNLLLGGEFDLVLNLDGFNEMTNSAGRNPQNGIFPFFPLWWDKRVGLTTEEILLSGHIGVLRQEQAQRAADAETSLLRWTAFFGLVDRYQQETTEAEIIQLNHELAAVESDYSLEKHGPRNWLEGEEELMQEAARVWFRGSVTLSELVDLGGAEYYHFLQPSQYAPEAKPLSQEEREIAYNLDGIDGSFASRGYPMLRRFNQELEKQGINYFDLTEIFADHPETLYIDECCHLNARGNELLAAGMVQRLAPALQRLGAAPPPAVVSGFDRARRPAEPDVLLFSGDFQVYLQEGVRLRYVRAECVPEDLESQFFLHLTPRDVEDLPPQGRELGFDNLDFRFADAGARLWQGQCAAQLQLPGYPIASLRTGQYAAAGGELWASDFTFPE